MGDGMEILNFAYFWQKYEFLLSFFAVRVVFAVGPGHIARNKGHFEPVNNYQRYIVLHSGTIGH